ncbi:MAG TPA: NAD-dependent epimerase/dehydratase family protein [Terracidiphilus sp.]|jgi:CDP-paratose 2-epimerase|nr:NAD-dependent epimerase/dehydratase family protein [Terracidiphilus sp.]
MLRATSSQSAHILITGGAGFIGANLAAHLLAATDARITIFDNLSHPGAELNLEWLRSQARASRLRFLRGDVCSAIRINEAVREVDEIYHLAARCEVPSRAREDFDVNATGTLNVLEASRCSPRTPMVIYVSTAKVYSGVNNIPVKHIGRRYVPANPAFRGISERMPVNLDFPYTSSMGAADRYVLDYSRLYNLPTVVLRPDTVAGPRQFENQGHGWVAHFVYYVLAGYPITVYGNGLQVRDVLHVSDLVGALTAARDYRGVTSGNAYNLGGGIFSSVSVNEMISLIERVCYRSARVQYAPARPGDRPFYVADTAMFRADTAWVAHRSLEQTVRNIAAFWHANQAHIRNPIALPSPLTISLPNAA